MKQTKKVTPAGCRSRHANFAVGVEHLAASRGGWEERNVDVAAHYPRSHVQRRLESREDVVVQFQLRVGVFVSANGDLVVSARVQVVKHHLVGAELGRVAEVRDVNA